MKESTGELSMVVVTLLAIALIAGIVRFLVPLAQNFIKQKWDNITTSYVEIVDNVDYDIAM